MDLLFLASPASFFSLPGVCFVCFFVCSSSRSVVLVCCEHSASLAESAVSDGVRPNAKVKKPHHALSVRQSSWFKFQLPAHADPALANKRPVRTFRSSMRRTPFGRLRLAQAVLEDSMYMCMATYVCARQDLQLEQHDLARIHVRLVVTALLL
jgi:hypothetical protein